MSASTEQPVGKNSDSCAKCDEMKTSVTPYARHVILCLPFLALRDGECIGSIWPSHIDDIDVVKRFSTRVKSAKENGYTIKLTACDYSDPYNPIPDGSTDPWNDLSHISVIVYPECFIVQLPLKNNSLSNSNACREISGSDVFLDWVCNPESTVTELDQQLSSVGAPSASASQPTSIFTAVEGSSAQYSVLRQVPWSKLVLVCVHGSRDKRCGRAGPQVIAALEKELIYQEEQLTAPPSYGKIQICGSSHIGGHKYAGTLVVYPECNWFGRVSKSSAKALLQHICQSAEDNSENDARMKEKCFRGNGFCANPDW